MVYFLKKSLLKEGPEDLHLIKVAEHRFQEPMPYSPLLLSYLWFGARFWEE